MKKTQHVLYFRKAEDARISNMTFSLRIFPEIFPKFSKIRQGRHDQTCSKYSNLFQQNKHLGKSQALKRALRKTGSGQP